MSTANPPKPQVFKPGDRVTITNYGIANGGRAVGRVVEYFGNIGPKGEGVYRVCLPSKIRNTYLTFGAENLTASRPLKRTPIRLDKVRQAIRHLNYGTISTGKKD